jgi:hypothetical protein
VKLLRASCGKRAAANKQRISTAVAACEGGVYAAAVTVPAAAGEACYVVAVALADGSVKRAAVIIS